MGKNLNTALTAALLSSLVGFGTPALATETATDSGRYSMAPTDGGFVRLDRQSGAMTFCTKAADATKPEAVWSCTPMGDAQQAANSEIERLQSENKGLKADKQHLEEMLGLAEPGKPGTTQTPPGDSASPPMKIPSEQDVDQAFDYIEGMVKKFRERIKKLEEQDTGKGQQL